LPSSLTAESKYRLHDLGVGINRLWGQSSSSNGFREQNHIEGQAEWLRRFWTGIFAGASRMPPCYRPHRGAPT
jgi:hypothetical protein